MTSHGSEFMAVFVYMFMEAESTRSTRNENNGLFLLRIIHAPSPSRVHFNNAQ